MCKQIALPAFLCFLAVLVITSGFSQQTMQARKTAYNNFVKEYRNSPSKLQALAKRDTFVHPFAVVAANFKQQKIYPDKDAFELIQALNPSLKMSSPSARMKFKSTLIVPKFTPPSSAVSASFTAEYAIASATDPELNAAFERNTGYFNNMITVMAQTENLPFSRGMWDSLNLLKTYALPAFNEHAGQISKTQMTYINNELATLVRLFGFMQKKSAKKINTAPPGNDEARKSFIIQDLFNLSNAGLWSVISPSKKTIRHTGAASAVNAAIPDYLDRKAGLFAKRPFVCNIYVFKIDPATQVADSVPVPARYALWLGNKGNFDDLIPGCDSTALGFPKNGNLASTLPVSIGFGSYIIIIKNISTGALFTKEVSPGTETEFEPNDNTVRKIIFLVSQ